MKQIIQRHLPLDVTYEVIDKKYIPILEGGGCTCDNCGKLIANIATVRSTNGTYHIGLDCLETFLLNNNLLRGFNSDDLAKTKKMISQVLRLAKGLKETFERNKSINITGLSFEKPTYETDYFPFYYLKNNLNTSRDNDYLKAKGMNFDFLIKTLQTIFPTLQILVK